MLLGHLLIDIKRWQPDVKGLDRDFLTIWKRYEDEGMGFLSVTLATICDALDKGLADGVFACPSAFSRMPGKALPKFLSGLLANIFDTCTGVLVDRPCIGSIKSVRELTRFYKKTELGSQREAKLHKAATAKFWTTDDECRSVTFGPTESHLLSRVCDTLLSNLDNSRFDEAEYRHGPGAVAEKVKANQKWRALYEGITTFDSSLTGHDIHIERSGESLLHEATFGPRNESPSQMSRLVTVPKTAVARRTITVEKLGNQFVQQGLNTILRDNIKRDRVLSSSLDLTDQTHNQKLAMEGSLTGKFATLDLSAASDRLSLKLVELVFGRHERFLSAALGCRADQVRSELRTAPLSKFAGMGNALTFPVQSIVFAAICYAAICSSAGLRPTKRTLVRLARNVRVFGDDIIVETAHCHQVVKWLEHFGLKVNTSKSFLSGKFRESCGVDAYDGVDVTPTYLRYSTTEAKPTPKHIASWVSTSNHLWLKGMHSTSDHLRRIVEEHLKRKLPLVFRRSGVLGWVSRRDTSDITHWCRKLQVPLVKGLAVSPVVTEDKLDGIPALWKFFHTSLLERDDPKHLERSVLRYNSAIRVKKVPIHTGPLHYEEQYRTAR
jgi:hypothetical protein